MVLPRWTSYYRVDPAMLHDQQKTTASRNYSTVTDFAKLRG